MSMWYFVQAIRFFFFLIIDLNIEPSFRKARRAAAWHCDHGANAYLTHATTESRFE
jgi:hypothetical protein